MLFFLIYFIVIFVEVMIGVLFVGWWCMDLFGVVIIVCVIVFGGGLLCDIVLGYYLLGWVKYLEYFGFIICVVLIVIWVVCWMYYFCCIFLVLDGLGLIVFILIGCVVVCEGGYIVLIVLIVGMLIGVFGGVLCDVLCNEVLLIF